MVASWSRHIAEEGEEKALLIYCSASFIFLLCNYPSTSTTSTLIPVIIASLQSTRDANVQQVDQDDPYQMRTRMNRETRVNKIRCSTIRSLLGRAAAVICKAD